MHAYSSFRHGPARSVVVAVVVVLGCSLALSVPGSAEAKAQAPAPSLPACDSSDPSDCGTLFDDFNYSSTTDSKLASHGWSRRSGSGGPGVSGATWEPNNISFPTVDGSQALRLALTTNGRASGTTEAEFLRTEEDSFAGSYLARIKFADAPVSGSDGDHVVQTFFTISSPPDCDPTYSELDFSEYLPNGGYGESRTFNSQTSWARTGDGCGDSTETDQYRSLAGWHTVFATVADGHVRYYIDGSLVGDASGAYFPRRNMAIDFNLWVLDVTGHSGSSTSTWNQDVDYVYYAENRALTLAQATTQVAAYRNAGEPFIDTVGAS
jgi:hypothetical protein